jgi:hypothetical protein
MVSREVVLPLMVRLMNQMVALAHSPANGFVLSQVLAFSNERPNDELQRTRPGFAWSLAAELSVRRTIER